MPPRAGHPGPPQTHGTNAAQLPNPPAPETKQNKPLKNFNYVLCKINTNDISPLYAEIGTIAFLLCPECNGQLTASPITVDLIKTWPWARPYVPSYCLALSFSLGVTGSGEAKTSYPPTLGSHFLLSPHNPSKKTGQLELPEGERDAAHDGIARAARLRQLGSQRGEAPGLGSRGALRESVTHCFPQRRHSSD